MSLDGIVPKSNLWRHASEESNKVGSTHLHRFHSEGAGPSKAVSNIANRTVLSPLPRSKVGSVATNHRISVGSDAAASQNLQKLREVVIHLEQTFTLALAKDSSNSELHINNLENLQKDLFALLGDTPQHKKISEEITKLKEALLKKPLDEEAIEASRHLLNSLLVQAAHAQEITESSQFLLATFKGIKQKVMLESSNKANDQIRKFQEQVVDHASAAGVSPAALQALSPEQRRQIYGNVIYLKERSHDLEAAELSPLLKKEKEQLKALKKLEKTAQKTESVVAKIATAKKEVEKLQKEIKQMHTRFQDLRMMIEIYEEKFAFTEHEKADPKFRALSVEAHRPTRNHLIMLSSDFFEGASAVLEERKKSHLATFLKEVEANGDTLLKELCHKEPPDLDAIKTAIINSDDAGLKTTLEKFEIGEKALDKFSKAIEAEKQKVVTEIGKGNRAEPLALEKEKWKKQMKEADDVIEKAAGKLKTAYIELEKNLGNTHEITTKQAGKVLTEARDAIINGKVRWSQAIDREMRLPVSTKTGLSETNATTLRHKMICPNQGYASSAFRGRVAGDLTQPNWWNVDVGVGDHELHFSRSSAQVEFFADDKEKRMNATKRQTLEVLSEKAEKRIQNLNENEKKEGLGASKDKPLVVKTTEVSLLTSVLFTDFLFSEQDPYLRKLIKEKTGLAIDISKWESRMLDENREAWMTFDSANATAWKKGETPSFTYVDKSGEKREVKIHVDPEKTPPITYEIIRNGKSCFVQFDIAYYNVGCSMVTKLLNEVISKKEINEKLEKTAKSILDAILKKIPNFLKNSIGRPMIKAFLKSKYGIELTTQDLEQLFDQSKGNLERLLKIAPAAIKGLLQSKEGKEALKGLLKKQGFELTEEHFNKLSQLKIPETSHDFINFGLSIFKEALNNYGAQEILIQGLVKGHKKMLEHELELLKKKVDIQASDLEKKYKEHPHISSEEWNKIVAEHEKVFKPLKAEYFKAKAELNDKVAAYEKALRKGALVDLAAIGKAIPDSIKLDDRTGIEAISAIGLPIVNALLSNETGRLLVQAAAAQKGKAFTTEELAKVKLPQVDLGRGSLAEEEEMNIRTFEKHKIRVNEKLKEIAEVRKKDLDTILGPEKDKALTAQEKEKNVKTAREKLLEMEKIFADAPNETNKVSRDAAFKVWQAARDDLAAFLTQEIEVNGKNYSESLVSYLKKVRYEDNLIALHDEVSDQLAFREYRSLESMQKSMYSLSSTIMALSIYLEEDPNTGCRSGKDRTSIQDMEICTKLAMLSVRGRILHHREMNDLEQNPETEEVREQLLLNSGQIDELAFKNIGSFGLNLSGGYGTFLTGFAKDHATKPWETTVTGGIFKAFRRSY